MDRRRFLMGMGAFAGAALVVPKAATIFDMGANRGLVLPEAPALWSEQDALLALSQFIPAPNQITASNVQGFVLPSSSAWADMQEYEHVLLPGSWTTMRPKTDYLMFSSEFTLPENVSPSFEYVDPTIVYPTYAYGRLTKVDVRP